MKLADPPFLPADCPTLAAAWAASGQLLHAFCTRLEALPPRPIVTLAAAGSLGRREAHAASDFDLVAIGGAGPGTAADLAPVFELAAALGLAPPKASGIYRCALPLDELCPPDARGSLDEAPAVFGKRMSLLLDAQPLWAADAFRSLQRDVLAWYAAGVVGQVPDAQWDFLLHDLQRYAHAYAGWQAFKFERDAHDGWLLRQAKLAGSRLLTFAGLLCLLGASSTLGRGKLEWVAEQLALTPLQRLQSVMGGVAPADFALLCADYEALHARLCDPVHRAQLVASSPASLSEALSPAPLQAEILRLGASLKGRIADFLFARRGEWHPHFFSGLLF